MIYLISVTALATLIFTTLIYRRLKTMATQAELAQALTAVGDRLDKARDEILTTIQELRDELANGGGTTPEVDAVVARLAGQAEGLDALRPDPENPQT